MYCELRINKDIRPEMENSTPRTVSLRSATFIVFGSMIGSGIFIVSADMARLLGSPFLLLLTWVITGLMTLAAALSYGELAAMFPKSGGQYQYLKEAYGPFVAFLFGWAMFAVVQSGTIAAVAVGFGKFTGVLVPFFREDHVIANLGFVKINAAQILAIVSLLVLTWINERGLKTGVTVQNFLTTLKIGMLAALIVMGVLVFQNGEVVAQNFGHFFEQLKGGPVGMAAIVSAMGMAMVGSLFSSDAWNNVTFIAGDIENPRRNVPLSLFLGVLGVTILFILANVSYLCVLPLWGDAAGADVLQKGIQHATQDRVGTAALTAMLGAAGASLMAGMIMISAFGCNNGLILAGARLYKAMADDGLFIKKMSETDAKQVPVFALRLQFVWCALLCLSGRYGDLLDYVMFVVVFFYILTIAGVILLRVRRPDAERPYKTFGYPLVPLLYIVLAAFFVVNLLWTKPQFTVPGLAIVLLGIPVYFFSKTTTQK